MDGKCVPQVMDLLSDQVIDALALVENDQREAVDLFEVLEAWERLMKCLTLALELESFKAHHHHGMRLAVDEKDITDHCRALASLEPGVALLDEVGIPLCPVQRLFKRLGGGLDCMHQPIGHIEGRFECTKRSLRWEKDFSERGGSSFVRTVGRNFGRAALSWPIARRLPRWDHVGDPPMPQRQSRVRRVSSRAWSSSPESWTWTSPNQTCIISINTVRRGLLLVVDRLLPRGLTPCPLGSEKIQSRMWDRGTEASTKSLRKQAVDSFMARQYNLGIAGSSMAERR
jgi:hypothetical protein